MNISVGQPKKKKRRQSNFTKVYMAFENREPIHYVRLGGFETKDFPHGIALATTFKSEEAAEEFADSVDAYIKQAFGVRFSSYAPMVF